MIDQAQRLLGGMARIVPGTQFVVAIDAQRRNEAGARESMRPTCRATATPRTRSQVVASRLAVDAVFVPGTEHFEGGEIPADLVAVADVITVSPEHTYARWSNGDLPDLSHVPGDAE
ncbi:hypothetical protein [Nocardia mexicana]|uniref:hypothetical protein n=1 Tax=Nocardia mexicana TaxID=279262 RepID=UPI0011C06A3A|nr:hypothetical protein [Nocardia mexicana]